MRFRQLKAHPVGYNIAYEFLEDDDPLKEHAKDVDLDPKDQGLTLEELYKSRTGKDLDINAYLGSIFLK